MVSISKIPSQLPAVGNICNNGTVCEILNSSGFFGTFIENYHMLIGQLSKQSGFSRDTIRYYEKIGLIVLPKRARRDNNYKDYPDEVLHQLKAIRKYKDLGFTLEEIRELIVLQSIKVLDVAKLIQLVDIKITGIDEEIDRLHTIRLQLSREMYSLTQQDSNRIVALPEMKLAA